MRSAQATRARGELLDQARTSALRPTSLHLLQDDPRAYFEMQDRS